MTVLLKLYNGTIVMFPIFPLVKIINMVVLTFMENVHSSLDI